MTNTALPLTGPGSQPDEEDVVLDYMQMPQGMITYHMPALPERAAVSTLTAALEKLDEVLLALNHWKPGHTGLVVDLGGLNAANRAFIDEVLGEGEVSIVAGANLQIQEAVLAGVWRVRVLADDGALVRDSIEIGSIPSAVHDAAFATAHVGVRSPDGLSAEGLLASPSLLAEVHNVLVGGKGDDATHSINLSLLPHTDEDLAFLDQQLGAGSVHILSRGYGNCRISSTTTRNVWWVRYFNSQDTLILNSLEVARIPEVAFAAVEDIHDSAQRLSEILDVYR
ncbi:MAG: hydrogenase expression/formation protein [Rhizobiales bacterium]|nr:hydrogenase expression/formation protein [Hyphomicrobiales bacterium]